MNLPSCFTYRNHAVQENLYMDILFLFLIVFIVLTDTEEVFSGF